ncbi:MAG TPA: aspartate--tRNA ligase [Gemmatimonadaceae bacterium]|nr:aspartate--tRNA ligase [Gemmatimonadaceae bacterium]
MTSPSNPFATQMRSRLAGSLRESDVGERVKLGGWVHRRRNLGAIVFLDLRDRGGLVQVSFDPKTVDASLIEQAAALTPETVVLIEGEVVARPPTMRNRELATGDVEVRPVSLRVVGPATIPAIPVARGKGEPLPAEEQRLRYRYLDLRRPELQESLILRHRLMQATRRAMSEMGFVEVETPILTKPTPEGARDYLVPSRVHPGEFYALPQSPQLYKQLLMVSGFDRYFQIARCFRDEDLRADRQPEFTQIDIEASFVTQDDVFAVAERLLRALWAEAGQEIETPFARMPYAEAMERFGTDRPDLRFGLELFDASDVFRESELTIARSALESGGRVRGLRIPKGAALSRKQVDELESTAKSAGAGGLLRLKRANGALEGPAAKFLSEGGAERLAVAEGDLLLLVAARDRVANSSLDRVRQEVARLTGALPASGHRFAWIVDFPLFATDEGSGALVPEHHPFTSPHPDDLALLDSAPARARAQAYDIVYNGLELASGSIRISDPALQSRIFSLLGIDEEAARSRFGFLLEGLRAGAPPHGGVALGFDRLAMLLAGGSSLRDVIAFPKTAAARALFEGAPTRVPPDGLRELHIRVTE